MSLAVVVRERRPAKNELMGTWRVVGKIWRYRSNPQPLRTASQKLVSRGSFRVVGIKRLGQVFPW